MKLPCDLP